MAFSVTEVGVTWILVGTGAGGGVGGGVGGGAGVGAGGGTGGGEGVGALGAVGLSLPQVASVTSKTHPRKDMHRKGTLRTMRLPIVFT